jgi:hypothetical protein
MRGKKEIHGPFHIQKKLNSETSRHTAFKKSKGKNSLASPPVPGLPRKQLFPPEQQVLQHCQQAGEAARIILDGSASAQ